MIICDEKHDEQTKGISSLRMKGVTTAGKHEVDFDLRLVVRGKHFCTDCYVEQLLKNIDFVKIIKDAEVKKKPGA